MAITTRYSQVRLEQKLSKAAALASSGRIENQYRLAAYGVADGITAKIRASGRGGEHNEDFAHQDVKVSQAKSGRYNINLGWLNPPASAHEKGGGGRLWYQYQDAGFHLFGGDRWIEGVGATVDRREDLMDAIAEVNRAWVREIAAELNR